MARNRARYLLVLLGAALFFFCFDGYLSLYTLVLVCLFPAVVFLVSLPGMLGLRLELLLGDGGVDDRGGKAAASAKKGGEIPLVLRAVMRLPLPAGRALVTLRAENTLTGESQEESFLFTPSRGEQTLEHKLTSAACGRVLCRVTKARAWDLLGLFWLPVKLPRERSALFYPAAHQAGMELLKTSMPDGEGERWSQTKPGDDPSELFGLREYREGDRLSRVHWKLSQKTGQTLVREMGLPVSDHLLILLEPNGAGTEADAALDLFYTVSLFLCQRETAHRVGYWDSVGKCFHLLEITDQEDARPALQTLLICGCQGSLPDLTDSDLPRGVSHILYLSCRPREGLAASLHALLPGARLSVFRVAEERGELALPADAELRDVQPGEIEAALAGFRL